MAGTDQIAQVSVLPDGARRRKSDSVERYHIPDRADSASDAAADKPGHPNTYYSEGVRALGHGDAEAAVELIGQALAIRRGQPLYYYVLGHALRVLQRPDDAIDAFEKCIRLRPDFAQAKWILGLLRIGLGNHANGLRLCREAVRLHLAGYWRRMRLVPQVGLAWLGAWLGHILAERGTVESHAYARIGRVYETSGDVEGAVVKYRKSLYHDADNFDGLCGLGRSLERLGYTHEAIPQLEKAVAIRMSDPGPLSALSELLGRQGRIDDAVSLAARAVSLAPRRRDALLAKGWARYRDGDAETAIDCFNAVIAQRPKTASALRGLGRCRLDMGQIDEASKLYKAAITADPDHTLALRDLVMIRTYFADHPVHKMMGRAAGHEHHSPPARMRLHYALGKLRDDIGAVDEAFEHFVLANELTDSIFDPKVHEADIGELINSFSTGFFAEHAEWGDPSDLPVFVVGMPRSGTTLVEHIIAGHPDAFGSGERTDISRIAEELPRVLKSQSGYPGCMPEIDRYAVQMGAARYLEKMHAMAPDARKVIDRTPLNFLHLGLIATLFPNARIIHCTRDPLDVCTAIYLCPYLESMSFAHDLTNIGLYYRQYERLMAHWKQTLGLSMLDVRYEDLVADPEPSARQIVEFLGLGWEPRCLKTHKTERVVRSVSSVEVRRQIYTGAVGRWKRYERHTEPLKLALGLADDKG